MNFHLAIFKWFGKVSALVRTGYSTAFSLNRIQMTKSSPSGWTDDMNIELPEHQTLDNVVALVISMGMQGADYNLVQLSLVENLGLSTDDAALAWDRVHGGIVRAATQQSGNCPNRSKDPLAWLGFQHASQDASIIASLYPQYADSGNTRTCVSTGETP
ncbi:hypothetical protein [Massilia antarctica]|uniref:hypothetical protein n=1 Tax=Massilia antarctica TaxID=2765360 RepID=UPI0011AED542|nr:hypothetical protein [Massilia sp. H27-R4]MCY0912471.1 hypothetical protein [Massilia sp. H27-R4]